MMNKILFWNIRSVNTQQAFERLSNLNMRNQYWLISLMEPFEVSSNIDKYKRTLGHHTALSNYLETNWLFARKELQINILADTTQHITIMVHHQNWSEGILFTIVYAACNDGNRRELWNSLGHMAGQYANPWGDW